MNIQHDQSIIINVTESNVDIVYTRPLARQTNNIVLEWFLPRFVQEHEQRPEPPRLEEETQEDEDASDEEELTEEEYEDASDDEELMELTEEAAVHFFATGLDEDEVRPGNDYPLSRVPFLPATRQNRELMERLDEADTLPTRIASKLAEGYHYIEVDLAMPERVWQEGVYLRANLEGRIPGQVNISSWEEGSRLLGLEAVLTEFFTVGTEQARVGMLSPTSILTEDWGGLSDDLICPGEGYSLFPPLQRGTTVVVLQHRQLFGWSLVWIPAENSTNSDYFPGLVMAGRIGWVPFNILAQDTYLTLRYSRQNKVFSLRSESIIFRIMGTYLAPGFVPWF
jgi:hypothetical protein